MTEIDEIFENDVIGKLESIKVANGYLNDASVLDGYMVHYVNDLLDEKDGLSFPCIAAQPEVDIPEQSNSGTKSISIRRVKVIGAVSVTKRHLVNRNLNSLLKDIHKAIHIDKFNNKSKAKEIVFGEAVFNLPDRNDQYAFFELTVNIKYVEHYND